jgi:hypothetical protein
MTDFVNLKIKLAQSFRGAHRGKMCVCVFIEVSDHTCISIYVYTVFLKKNNPEFFTRIIFRNSFSSSLDLKLT